MDNRREYPDPISDLIYHAAQMASWLRWLRNRRGLSVRALEAVTGITDSEIIKIETAQQECRLSSFVRICSALGVPAGWALDVMIKSNTALFHRRIVDDPGFPALMETMQVREKREQDVLALQLTCASVLAAILVRVSAPVRRARFHTYPTEEWKGRFLRFAERLESNVGAIDRTQVARGLREQPVAQLQRLGLLSRASLEQKRDDVRLLKAKRRGLSFGGELWSLTFAEVESLWGLPPATDEKTPKRELTDTETPSKVLPVKAQLPGLLERLKEATAGPGKKTELAEFLSKQMAAKVPLASVSRWLSGEREPGGEVALQLDAWVAAQGFPRAR